MFFPNRIWNLKNHMWVAPRARGAPLQPPFVASLLSPASAQALGPSGVPEKFQFIFLSGFMKPPKVSIFAPKNIRETPETIKKINETRSQKKNAWFPIKTLL